MSKSSKAVHATTDAGGRFSLPFSMPSGVVSAEEAKQQAVDVLRPIFNREANIASFLRSVDFIDSTSVSIFLSTDAKSVAKDQNEKSIITEGDASVSVTGCRFNKERLMASLRDYFHELALSAINVQAVDVTIEVRDAISRTEMRSQTSIGMEMVEGLTPSVMREQMLVALRRVVKPAYVRRYLPPDSDLPRIKILPFNYTIAGAKRFRIHVSATYKIKAAHPDYVYVEGRKKFSLNSRTATI